MRLESAKRKEREPSVTMVTKRAEQHGGTYSRRSLGYRSSSPPRTESKKGPLVSLVTSKPNHNTTDETHGGRVPVVPSVSLLRPVTFGQVEDGGEGRSDDDLLHLGRR